METTEKPDKPSDDQEDAGSTEVEKAVHLMKENESQGDLFGAMQTLKSRGQEDEVEKFFSMTDKMSFHVQRE